jgi:hypothetical protein
VDEVHCLLSFSHQIDIFSVQLRWRYGTEQYLEVVRLSVDWAELH